MRHNKKAVRCVETGQVYPSAVEASLALGKNHMSVAISISKGCKSGGYTWQYVEDDKKYEATKSMDKIFNLFQSIVRLVPMSDTSKAEVIAQKFEQEIANLQGCVQS